MNLIFRASTENPPNLDSATAQRNQRQQGDNLNQRVPPTGNTQKKSIVIGFISMAILILVLIGVIVVNQVGNSNTSKLLTPGIKNIDDHKQA